MASSEGIPVFRWSTGRLFCAAVLMGLTATTSAAQNANPAPRSGSVEISVQTLTARVITGSVKIDGRLAEPAWAELPVWSAFEQRAPDEGAAPTERTDVRVGYDANALYVGIRCYDSDPTAISRQLSRRDGSSVSDWVAVYLDPRHDHLTGALFRVSAAGVQSDSTIFNDFETDDSWDAVWDSAVSLDDQGWVAEIRIPFSQLRFSLADASEWGINIRRFIFRKNEDLWARMSPRVEDRVLSSQFAHLAGVEGIRPHRHLEILPYVASTTESSTAESSDPFNGSLRQAGSLGLDAKWGPTNALTLDATFNPDFGQVELDPSVINLTEFETSFEEKRPFFLEGASLFRSFGQIGSGTQNSAYDLFYSRRIGRSPQLEADGDSVDAPRSTTILGAGKLTGKFANGWSVGVLEALTSREMARVFVDGKGTSRQPVEPFSSYFVGRALRESDLGGMGLMTTLVDRRLDDAALRNELPSHALVQGFDGYRFLRNRRWVVSGQAVLSRIVGSPAAILQQQLTSRRYYQRPDSTYVDLDPDARSLTGWNTGLAVRRRGGTIRPRLSLTATSPAFEVNDAGFQTRADRFGISAGVDWYNYTPGKYIRSRTITVSNTANWNFGGQIQRNAWTASASLVFPSYWEASSSYSLSLATLDDHLTRGGPLGAAPRSQSISGSFGSDSRKKLWYGGGTTVEWDHTGGWNTNAYLSMRADPSSRVRLTTGPYVYRSRNSAQYFTTVEDATASTTFGSRYVFAGLDQTQVSLTTRADISLSPVLSVQVYLQPFLAVGRYDTFQEFLKPGTFTFRPYGVGSTSTLTYDPVERTRTVDPDGKGPAAPFELFDGDFNSKTIRLKSVIRWEWRPGSTLYVAWTQGRYDGRYPGDFSFGRDLGAAFTAPADNAFLIKATYWIGQ